MTGCIYVKSQLYCLKFHCHFLYDKQPLVLLWVFKERMIEEEQQTKDRETGNKIALEQI
jgi:hypothetical protein